MNKTSRQQPATRELKRSVRARSPLVSAAQPIRAVSNRSDYSFLDSASVQVHANALPDFEFAVRLVLVWFAGHAGDSIAMVPTKAPFCLC